MATLLIPSAEIASVIETDIEGRLEVLADDGNKDSPDYEDLSAVAEMIRQVTSFPFNVQLSDAEANLAHSSVENCIELSDDDAETETLETVRADLARQGYPWGSLQIAAKANDRPDMQLATRTRIALETALSALAHTTHVPEEDARRAIETIKAMIAQRGCDEFGVGGEDDLLTTMCDVIIYG
jgi:hypothetical protein